MMPDDYETELVGRLFMQELLNIATAYNKALQEVKIPSSLSLVLGGPCCLVASFSDSRLVEALASYGNDHGIDYNMVLNDPKAMVHAITLVYGSIDDYEQNIKENIEEKAKILSGLEEKINAWWVDALLIPIKAKDAQTAKKVEGIKDSIIKSVEEIVNFGTALIDNYRLIKEEEVLKYRCANKAQEGH